MSNEIVAERRENSNKQKSFLSYFTSETTKEKYEKGFQEENDVFLLNPEQLTLHVMEDTNFVDGIGGATWEGALLLCRILEGVYQQASPQKLHSMHLLELGAGTGLVGILASMLGFKTTITDRFVDLANANVSTMSNFIPIGRKHVASTSADYKSHKPTRHSTDVDALSTSLARADIQEDTENYTSPNDMLAVRKLDWHSAKKPSQQQSNEGGLEHLLYERGVPDLIFGAEITCLKKQHEALLAVIDRIRTHNPHSLFLFTFDDLPNQQMMSKYEQEFIAHMVSRKLQHAIVMSGTVKWAKEILSLPSYHHVEQHKGEGKETNTTTTHWVRRYTGTLTDVTKLHEHALYRLSFPTINNYNDANTVAVNNDHNKAEQKAESKQQEHKESKSQQQQEVEQQVFAHHVRLFYPSAAVNTCARCQQQFFHNSQYRDILHTNNACRFHKGYFVCRKHPGEVKLSINGQGDSLGYYGNGQEDWAAKFWDCCGSEDPKCLGCCADYHIPYV